MQEQTLFFVKHRHLHLANDIYTFAQEKLTIPGQRLIQSRAIVTLDESGWREFYNHLQEKYAKALDIMVRDFAGKQIDLAVLSGEDIAARTKKLVGPTVYEENPETIRGRWGPYEMPHTIVHASDPEAVQKDLAVMLEHGKWEQ